MKNRVYVHDIKGVWNNTYPKEGNEKTSQLKQTNEKNSNPRLFDGKIIFTSLACMIVVWIFWNE